MIAHLKTLIAAAIKEIDELEKMIIKSEEELEKCYQLKPILNKISNNALSGYNSLQRAGNSLNAGIKIGEVGQGENILKRSVTIKKLNLNAEMGSVNVQTRINKLQKDIEAWNLRITKLHTDIAGWEAEIVRLEREEETKAAAKRALRNIKG